MLRPLVCALIVFHASIFHSVTAFKLTDIDHLYLKDNSSPPNLKVTYIVQERDDQEGDLVKVLPFGANRGEILPHTADMLTNGYYYDIFNTMGIVGSQNRTLYIGVNQESTYLAWTSQPYIWRQYHYSDVRYIDSDMPGAQRLCWGHVDELHVKLEKCTYKNAVRWHSERMT